MSILDDPILVPAAAPSVPAWQKDPIVKPAMKLDSHIESNHNQPWNQGAPIGGIMDHPLDSLWQAVNTPAFNIHPPKALIEKAEKSGSIAAKAGMGIAEGATDLLSSFTSPLGAAAAVTSAGLAKSLPAISKIALGLFALQTGKQAAVDIPKQLGTMMGQNKQDRNLTEEIRAGTGEVANLGLAGVLGKNVIEKAPIAQPPIKPSEMVANLKFRPEFTPEGDARMKELENTEKAVIPKIEGDPVLEYKQVPTLDSKQATTKPNISEKEKPTLSPIAKSLGLDKSNTMSELLTRIGSHEKATKEQTQAADFLNKHFSHILSFSDVDVGKQPGVDRASYQPDMHKTFLDVENEHGDLIRTILHEAGHAALDHLLQQKSPAAERFEDLRQHLIDSLPTRVNKFYREVYKPWDKAHSNATFNDEDNLFRGHNLDTQTWKDPLYFLLNSSEMAAGIFTPESNFREMLTHTEYKDKSVWEHVKDVVRDLFGINKNSALEEAFNNILELSKQSKNPDNMPDSLLAIKDRWEIEQKGVEAKQMPRRKLPSEEPKGTPGEDVLWIADSAFTDPPKGKFRDWYNQKLSQISGVSMPKTMALNKDTGNAAIRYASARIAGPLMGKALASEVLGTEPYIGEGLTKKGQSGAQGKARWNDTEWQNKVGAALVEDRLRSVWYKFKEAGNDEAAAKVQHVWDSPDSPLHNQAEVSAVLNDPEVKASVERFKKLVEGPAREMHVKLGGKLAFSGPESGAFINLKNLGDRAESMLRGGSKQGDITNPLKRGSVHDQTAKGTGKNYDFNFRNIIDRMVQGNYEEYTKQHMYQEYVKAGLAVVAKPGEVAPEGKQKIAIDRRSKKALNLWVRNDIASELRQVLQTDSPVDKGARQWLINRLTDAQLIGPVDVTVHLHNMFSAIAGSQGGENLAVDLARKIPGIRGLDTIVRVVKATKDIMLDTPEIQKKLAEDARIGAGRGTVVHKGLVGKIGTGKLVQLIDKASRLTLSRMYDNLIERDLAKDTQEGRREFINRMGQYNSRLMGRFEQLAKQTSVSPFIVAGKNFNRLALQRLTLNPGIQATNREAAMKMQLVEAVGLVSTLMAMPMAVNYYTVGNIWGRPGISPGAIDTGKTDKQGKPIQVDLVQNILIRRGLRNIGAMAAYKDISQGRSETDIIHDAFMDQVKGYASPWEGPGVREASIGLTGYDIGGYLESDNPHSLGQNLLAALRQSNPTFARYFQSKEAKESTGVSATKAVDSQVISAFGVGEGRKPSLFEQERDVPGIEKMNLSERAKLQKSFVKDSTQMSPRQRLTMEQEEVARSHQVQQTITHDLKPETQNWLKDQHLEVPGFAEYLTQTGVKVYLLPEEREKYMQIMVDSYENAVRMAKPFVERAQTQENKKKELAMFINRAHGIARNKMKLLINSGSE